MLPITGVWNNIKYGVDIKEKPKEFDVNVNVGESLCYFRIEDGKIVRFSLIKEAPDYDLLATLIGHSVYQCGYKKVEVSKRPNVIRVDESNPEKRKLMESINKTKIGELSTYSSCYSCSIGSQNHEYAEGTIRGVPELFNP